MKELADIINERDSKFKKNTFEILTVMDITIESIETFLGTIEPMFNIGIFSWNDVYLEDELITILGDVCFEDGMKFDSSDGTVNITTANADYYHRVIRMSLPYELVTTDDADAIIPFLQKLHAASNAENKPEPNTAQEFDLSELTSEQKAALELYNSKERDSLK